MAERDRNRGTRTIGRMLAGGEANADDQGDDDTLERVEVLAAGAEKQDDIEKDGLGEKLAELAATTEEEVDALRVNLLQDDRPPTARDGSGRVVDDSAEERTARSTEAMRVDLGVLSVEPGRDNTSGVLRRQQPDTTIARSEAIVEGNLDEPMDETIIDPKVDEGTSG